MLGARRCIVFIVAQSSLLIIFPCRCSSLSIARHLSLLIALACHCLLLLIAACCLRLLVTVGRSWLRLVGGRSLFETGCDSSRSLSTTISRPRLLDVHQCSSSYHSLAVGPLVWSSAHCNLTLTCRSFHLNVLSSFLCIIAQWRQGGALYSVQVHFQV